MVYEVLRRELAMNFKSITYSYKGDEDDGKAGTFTATFVPWEQTDKYRHGHRSTEIKFNICADREKGTWTLSNGTVKDIEGEWVATVRFTHDGHNIALNISEWYEIRLANGAYHTREAVTPLNKEPWPNLYNHHTI